MNEGNRRFAGEQGYDDDARRLSCAMRDEFVSVPTAGLSREMVRQTNDPSVNVSPLQPMSPALVYPKVLEMSDRFMKR